MNSITTKLEQVFERIHRQRMQGMPILNHRLRVEAVGFMRRQGYYLGVLITPWFMNLMLLPDGDDARENDQAGTPGSKVLHRFPSGPYEFIVGHEAGIGAYQMCSLFSPVFEFADQQAAVATAVAVMHGIMDQDNHEPVDTCAADIDRLWHGDPEPDPDADASPAITLSQRLQQPISRRELLTGRTHGRPD